MNPAKFRSTLGIGYFLSAIPLLAHPGHDLREATFRHLFTSPDHLAVLVVGGAALWLVGRFAQRQLPRRLLQGAGLAVVVTAIILWGIRT
jgi:hypothetical protein